MSILSNNADSAAEAAGRYVDAILSLVGDRDPMEILRATPDRLSAAVAGLDEQALRREERPGKWSAAQVVQHMADSELVWAYRLRRVLAEDRPTLTGFDQDAWAEALRYADSDVPAALVVVRAVRAANLALLASASPEDLDRVGVHVERGDESLRQMIPLYAGHDLAHLGQLERIRGVVEADG